MLKFRGRTEGVSNEHQSNPWQKIVGPARDELDNEGGQPAWIRKYLDLADLLISRVQHRLERSALHRRRRHRDAA